MFFILQTDWNIFIQTVKVVEAEKSAEKNIFNLTPSSTIQVQNGKKPDLFEILISI